MQQRENNNSFQRKRNSPRNKPDGPRGGYHSWKNQKVAPVESVSVPKEKVLGPEDFPALPTGPQTSKRVPDHNSWTKPETSLAERVKEQIAKEEARLQGQVVEEEEKLDVIPLSTWMRAKYLAKKREEEMMKREEEEEEETYRWQISRKMIPDPPEPEMEAPDYESEEGQECGEWQEEEHE